MTSDIRTVTLIGTGVLGSQIAYQTAYCGYSVIAYDVNDKALDAARANFRALAATYELEVEGAGDGRAQSALARITCTSDLAEAVRGTDLVIEAAPEKLELKRDIYQKLDQHAPRKTIFATNSSTLLPSDMAASTGRPERFVALHFAVGVWIHNIGEVMGHPGTDPAVYQTVVEFARSIGMEPIELKREQPGYVSNSLVIPWLFAAVDLLVNDVADPEMIDRTWCIASGASEGPLQALDAIGLVTPYNIAAGSPDEQSQARAKYLKEHYIDKGKLGRATGEGIYKYPTEAQAA